MAAARNRRQNGELLGTVSHRDANLRNCNGYVTDVDDLDAQTWLTLLENRPDWMDSQTHAVTTDGEPCIDDAENRSGKSENQTRNSCDERDVVHGVMQANVQSSGTRDQMT